MKKVNIVEFKNKLSSYVSSVAEGEEVYVCKHNVPVAKVVPIERKPLNRTKLGCMRDSAKARGDLTEPLIPPEDWGGLLPADG
jgi:prevent-host-death family protein